MSDSVKTALTLAMLWAILKMVFYMSGNSEMGFNVGAMSNFLFIIAASAITLWFRFRVIKRNESDTITDFTTAAKASILYVIFASTFSFVYYKTIDTQFLENRAQARVEQMDVLLSQEGKFEEIKAMDDHLTEDLTKETFMTNYAKNAREQMSIKYVVFYAFSIWIFVSMISAIVITVLFRQVLLK